LAYEVDAFGISVSIVEPGGHATDLIRTPPAADDARVLSGYGELADAPQKMISMFEDMFAQEEAINDPNNVAVAISDAIECQGKPPLRIEVGAHMGVSEINRKTATPQNDLIAALGFAPLAKGKSAGFIAVVDFPVRPEHLDACEAALLDIVPDTLAEPGCVLFAPVRSEDPSAGLKLIEAFGSEDAVSHHMKQPYTKAFLEKANGWFDGPIKSNVLQGSEVVMRQFT
jgi:quinol monooxygenase YgiN